MYARFKIWHWHIIEMFIHKNCINNIDSGITDYETKSFVDNNKNIDIKGAHDVFLEWTLIHKFL
jgi:hypothetical protein